MINLLNPEKVDSQIRLINNILRKDRELINSRFSFFLGAGCSVSSGIPLAPEIISILKKLIFIEYHLTFNKIIRTYSESLSQFLNRVDEYILKYHIDYSEFVSTMEDEFRSRLLKDTKRIENHFWGSTIEETQLDNYKNQLFQDNLYGLWFEKYSSNPRKRQALIEEIIENIEPSGAYILFSQLIKLGYIRNVFTTNFDDLISDALVLYFGEKPKVYSHNEIAQYIHFSDKKPNIIKLHGDFLYENIKNLSNETKQLDPNMEKKFSEALVNKDIVFLGYNGSDESIMRTIIKIRKESKFTIYWCGIDEKNLHWRVIQLLNEFEDAYFIKIRDFDDFIFELFTQTPERSEVNIVKKAKANEAKMKQYLNTFYKKRFKRSHKIYPEEYSQTEYIEQGLELLDLIEKDSSSPEQITKYYRILSELHPKTPWLINNYAVSILKNGNHADSYSILKEAVCDHPDFYLFWYNLGVIYHDTNRLEDAVIAFSKACTLNDNFGNSFNNLAATYNSQREFKKALSSIERAINIERKGKYLVIKGIILKNQNRIKEAIELYDEAINKKEDVLEALLNKSNALRLLNEYELAIEYSLEALDISTEHEYIYATLAEIYAEKGDSDKFYFYLLEAVKRNYPIWRHLDDRAFRNYKNENQFKNILNEYCPINT